MAAQLLSFFRPASTGVGDWSNQEIAEFYRVEAALVQAGMSIAVDRGVSDEGDPWFVFCRANDGEVIVHFARVDGQYVIVAESAGRALQGADFRRLLAEFVSSNPTLIAMPPRGSKLLLHPASLLAAVVATALYHMLGTEAVANTLDPAAVDDHNSSDHGSNMIVAEASTPHGDGERKWYDRQIAAAVVAMMALAATEFNSISDPLNTISSALVDLTEDRIHSVHSVVAHSAPASDVDSDMRLASLLDPSDAHGWLESLSAFSVSQTVNELKGNAEKAPLPASQPLADMHTETSHNIAPPDGNYHSSSIDTSTFLPNEIQLAIVERSAVASSPPSSSNSGGNSPSPSHGSSPAAAPTQSDAHLADASHNSASGSSSPDRGPAASSLDFQSATIVSNVINSSNHDANQINLADNLSVHDVIVAGASGLFGADVDRSITSGSNILAANSFNPAASSSLTSSPSPVAASVSGSPSLESATSINSMPVSQQTHYAAFDSNANQLIAAFASQNSFEVLNSDHNYVLFDTDASHFSSPDFVVKTWEMTDGSTITIVGQLPHELALLA